MNLKELITNLEAIYILNPKVESTGYGEQEAYSVSKEGVIYPRAYLYLIEADMHTVALRLTVTADVLPDLSNRLDVQSETLTIIKELVQQTISAGYLQFDVDVTFVPTRLYQEDQSEGYKTEFEIVMDEPIDVCLIPKP